MRPFRAMWAALKDTFEELLLMIVGNLLWVLISGPLLLATFVAVVAGLPVIAVLMALLSVLPMAPATAGLYTLAHRTVEGRASSWRDFIAGMRRYAVSSWKVLGIWMAMLVIILADLAFYSSVENSFGGIMVIFWFYLLIIWFGVLIYLFPLMLLQEEFNLRVLGRNIFLMTMGRPIFTLITLVLMVVIALLTSITRILPLILTVALLAQWSMRATVELLKEAEERRAALEQAAAEPPEKGRRGQVRPK